MDLPKRYDPKSVEEKWYSYWEAHGFFSPAPEAKTPTYTIVIPPPNVTGILHMGHALNNTIQDVLIRFKRMQGFKTLWIPGTDHAGIATQNVVEKSLHKQNKKRSDFSREEFVGLVWDWTKKHGGTIIGQLKKLGCSCDWSRQCFTMDPKLSDAVGEAFRRLSDKGLIYKGEYIINWCPRCTTALSDEEAEKREQEGFLYYIRYPLEGEKEYLVVATTRPETMLGDTAVAVNPKDERFRKFIGKKIRLPLANRIITVIEDEFVDPEFGTGAVKVTPSHDPNDYAMGKRHNLAFVTVIDERGIMNKAAGERYQGLERFACRKKVIEDLEKENLLVEKKPHVHAVGRCYRCDTVIEPYLSKQWFVRMKPLAEAAIRVVEKGEIKFYPERWTKVYLNWMNNIRDWCISRQIWWGHRIPVYYCKKCQNTGIPKSQVTSHKSQAEPGIIVARIKPDQCPYCGSNDIYQDEDVLDTWFSSWLWPLSTLGWPEKTVDLKTFYPTQTLVTAAEIIFFWVARMIAAGLEFEGKIPFDRVYIHGTVRDEQGRKMSKSLGNTIDPLMIIEKYSADALRFSIITLCARGQDVYLSEEKFEIGRNFANKLWNASRFLFLTYPASAEDAARFEKSWGDNPAELLGIHRWILSRMTKTIRAVTASLESFDLGDAVHLLRDFFWGDFCDWYLEMLKVEKDHPKHKAVTYYVFFRILKLLHPFIPFITEEISSKLTPQTSIMIQAWPKGEEADENEALEKRLSRVQDVIRSVRNVRKEKNMGTSKPIKVILSCSDETIKDEVQTFAGTIKQMTNSHDLILGCHLEKPPDSAAEILEGVAVYIPMEGLIDIAAEKERLSKESARLQNQVLQLGEKLSDKEFLQKAPEDVINRMKDRQNALARQHKKIKEDLDTLIRSKL